MSDNSDNVCTLACSIAHSHTENYRQFHRVLLNRFQIFGVQLELIPLPGSASGLSKGSSESGLTLILISLDNSFGNGDIYY